MSKKIELIGILYKEDVYYLETPVENFTTVQNFDEIFTQFEDLKIKITVEVME